MLHSCIGIHAWWEMVQNYLHKLINIWKQWFSVYNKKKGPVKRVTSKNIIVYIMVLIGFKYKVAMASQSYQWKI